MAWAGIHGEIATFQNRAMMEIIPFLYTIRAPKSTSNGIIARTGGNENGSVSLSDATPSYGGERAKVCTGV
jgi:hypothetical protein